jgi:lipoate-protein ligase A
MLFERLTMYHERTPMSAAMNMAMDEALLEQATGPILRFYGWRRPSLSFGYFGRFAEVAEEARTRELVRRWTGGGIVLHGEDLTYSLLTPPNEAAFALSPPAIYAALHGAIRDALQLEGKQTELVTKAGPKISDACFENAVRNDLTCRGRKIAGAAQRRTRRGFLHQGSIQLPDLSESFRERFAAALASEICEAEIPPSILDRAAELAEQKYAAAEWLHRW